MSHQFWKSSRRLGLLVMIGMIGMMAVRAGWQTDQRVTAQSGDSGDSCDALIQEALQLSANFCLELGRNEACYGYHAVSTVLSNPDAEFAERGDIVSVTELETVITRPIDPTTGEWGIVMMNLDADLPDTSGDTVRLLLFGGGGDYPRFTGCPRRKSAYGTSHQHQ